jgi:hypothetical protein
MPTNKSQRITVSGRNLKFLRSIAEQMDETNLTDALSYLLTDVRCLGYSIGNKPVPVPQPQQSPIGYAFDPTTFEPAFPPTNEQNHTNNQADDTILRLASLIENF